MKNADKSATQGMTGMDASAGNAAEYEMRGTNTFSDRDGRTCGARAKAGVKVNVGSAGTSWIWSMTTGQPTGNAYLRVRNAAVSARSTASNPSPEDAQKSAAFAGKSGTI